MNQRTDHLVDHGEMIRRTTFICLGVVLAIVAYRAIGGRDSISEGFCQARSFAVEQVAILSQTVCKSGESLTHYHRRIAAILRALSCIREELRTLSQPNKTTPLRREVPRVSMHSVHTNSGENAHLDDASSVGCSATIG